MHRLIESGRALADFVDRRLEQRGERQFYGFAILMAVSLTLGVINIGLWRKLNKRLMASVTSVAADLDSGNTAQAMAVEPELVASPEAEAAAEGVEGQALVLIEPVREGKEGAQISTDARSQPVNVAVLAVEIQRRLEANREAAAAAQERSYVEARARVIVQRLALSEAEGVSVTRIIGRNVRAKAELLEAVQGGRATAHDYVEGLERIDTEADAAFQELLTPEQRETYKALALGR